MNNDWIEQFIKRQKRLSLPFILIWKCGRLPEPTIKQKFQHEYGIDCFEMEEKALSSRQKVPVIDDLLATDGSMEAACFLAQKSQADILEAACLIDLQGRCRLSVLFFPLFQEKLFI